MRRDTPEGIERIAARSGAQVTLVLLLLAFTSVFFGGRTLRNGPGMPGVVPFGAEGARTVITPPHTMDTVPAFIDEPLAVEISRVGGSEQEEDRRHLRVPADDGGPGDDDEADQRTRAAEAEA